MFPIWEKSSYPDRMRYSPMCNEEGGVVDDLIVYRMAADKYFVVVNASNRHKDVAWMKAHLIVHEVLMAEPTETESKATLDEAEGIAIHIAPRRK